MKLDNIITQLKKGDITEIANLTGYSFFTVQKVFKYNYDLKRESSKTIIAAAKELIRFRKSMKPKRTKRAYTIKSKTNN